MKINPGIRMIRKRGAAFCTLLVLMALLLSACSSVSGQVPITGQYDRKAMLSRKFRQPLHPQAQQPPMA